MLVERQPRSGQHCGCAYRMRCTTIGRRGSEAMSVEPLRDKRGFTETSGSNQQQQTGIRMGLEAVDQARAGHPAGLNLRCHYLRRHQQLQGSCTRHGCSLDKSRQCAAVGGGSFHRHRHCRI
ncbi:hypothetical protein HC891_09850 [Candidatus Gracilibacteria bacterium]|nr:hypothetical protein [Candidatus Gracilibacteria bacterium]